MIDEHIFLSNILTALSKCWRRYRREALRRPEVLRKWYRWQSIDGKYVNIFFVSSLADKEEIMQIACGCDETLQRVTDLLGVRSVKRPITVFLYSDMHSFQRCEQIQGTRYIAIARKDSVSLPYEPWPQIARFMAHELTHVVGRQLIATMPIFMLNEGLAMYVESKLYPFETQLPVPGLNSPLQTLANYHSFLQCLNNPEAYYDAYPHAHSLALYLVHRGGMDHFLTLIRRSAHRKVERWEKRFAAAVRKIYGLSLDDMEQQWRQDSAITREGTMLCWEWMLPTAQTAIRNSQERALQQRSKTVESEHLLWAILQDRPCLASCLITRITQIKDILQSIENLPVHERAEEEERPVWATTTRQCVALAIHEARSLNCTYIGTEHLLLGLLGQQTNSGCLILSKFGVDLDRFRAAVEDYYRMIPLRERVKCH